MDEYGQIRSALIEIRNACMQCVKNEQGIRKLMDKYDMIFSGKQLSTIITIELAHTLATKFNIAIEHEELCKVIPKLCKELGMTYTTLYPVEEMGKGTINPEHVVYQIDLY